MNWILLGIKPSHSFNPPAIIIMENYKEKIKQMVRDRIDEIIYEALYEREAKQGRGRPRKTPLTVV